MLSPGLSETDIAFRQENSSGNVRHPRVRERLTSFLGCFRVKRKKEQTKERKKEDSGICRVSRRVCESWSLIKGDSSAEH